MSAFTFEIEDTIDHMFDHARACNLAVFGNMSHQHDCGTSLLGIADHGLCRRTHLRDRAGSRICHIGPERLDRIDDDEIGSLGIRNGSDDVFDVGFGSKFHR